MDFCEFWLVRAKLLKPGGDMTRRSLAVMSAVDGSVFIVYQGASRRRASASAGWWPEVAYQQTAIAWQANINGTVRSTAWAVRLRLRAEQLLCVFYRDFN